jgi:peptide deformylase
LAKYEIKLMGDPVLRVPAEDIPVDQITTEETQTLIQDMLESMNELGGIGIAGPQLGISKKVALIDLSCIQDEDEEEQDGVLAIINPKMTVLDENVQGFWEGCLSVPGLRGFVERPRKIKIEYYDQDGKEKTLVAEDFLATVFQHELDHLFATLYVDRIKDTKLLVFEETFGMQEQEEG